MYTNITTTGIEEEREFYDIYEEKDWIRIKNKTRQLRLDETESDFALRKRLVTYGAKFGGRPGESSSSDSSASSDQDRTPSPEELPIFQRRMFRGRDRAGGRDTVSLFNIQFN